MKQFFQLCIGRKDRDMKIPTSMMAMKIRDFSVCKGFYNLLRHHPSWKP